MRNIIVVDCTSSGVNYIVDIVNRRYNPVVLELKPVEGYEEANKKKLETCYGNISDKFDIIYEKDTYEETLEAVREYNPKVIVSGSEHGVILTTKLANDLNLLGNPIENVDYFTLKDKMQEKIAEAGLRHIRGKSVRSIEEAIEYYDSESFEEVVIKPVYSAGSVGVFICLNKQEMIDAINELLNLTNYCGEKIEEFVVQERIKGDEFYVNTVSCDGLHQVSLIWKYGKVKTSEGSIIYDTIETVNELGIGESEMVEYAYNVADALGIKYGPIHGEYMIDDKGPVLIEVNCRPAGCSMPAEYLDMIAGHHETDLFLDSYLKPKRVHERRKKRYRLLAHGALKIFIVPNDIIARSAPMNNISPKLKSFYKSNLADINNTEIFYVKTRDLETTCGYIYLVHEDAAVLHNDLEFLRSIEKHAFSLVLSEENTNYVVDEDKIIKEIKKIVDMTSEYGAGLLITDQFLDECEMVQISIDEVNEVNGEFDFVIINLNKSLIDKRDDITVDIILNILSNIRVGGIVYIPKTTYNFLPDKRKGIEALIKTLGLRIEVPPHGIKTGVIASKERI